jgi:uncharacterized coiled-coil DUF342 family protein
VAQFYSISIKQLLNYPKISKDSLFIRINLKKIFKTKIKKLKKWKNSKGNFRKKLTKKTRGIWDNKKAINLEWNKLKKEKSKINPSLRNLKLVYPQVLMTNNRMMTKTQPAVSIWMQELVCLKMIAKNWKEKDRHSWEKRT